MNKRPIPPAVAQLGLEVKKRLPPPYDLIAEWADYIELSVLLKLDFGIMIEHEDNGDGTETMRWSDVPSVARDIIVPRSLYRRTHQHLVKAPIERPPMSSISEARIFGNAHGAIGLDHFLTVLRDAITDRQ